MSGRNNHGTLTNMDAASDWVVSGGKYALDFDGSNDYVSLAPSIAGLFKVTVSVWFYWYAYATNDDLLMEYTPNTNLGGNRGFIINPNNGSAFSILVTSGGSPYNGGTIPRPAAAAWHHLCVLFDRTLGTANNVSAWVDGQEVTVTQTQTGNITTSFSSSSLYLASRNGSSLFGNCMIDDMMLFDGLLPANNIRRLASRRGIAYETKRRTRYRAASTGIGGSLTRSNLLNAPLVSGRLVR